MNRAERRRHARVSRPKLNTVGPDGRIHARKQHGRVCFIWDAARHEVEREFNASHTNPFVVAFPDAPTAGVIPGVAPAEQIYAWADQVAEHIPGAIGDRVLVYGYCEHIRQDAADQLGIGADPAILQSFAHFPEGWLVFAYMPAVEPS